MSETKITLTLASDALLGTGRITVEHGNNTVLGSFDYKTIEDLADAIAVHLDELNDFQMPAITLSDEDEWDPDLEVKREQFVVGTWVKTPDGVGCITTREEDPPKDEVWVDVDGFEDAGTYPLVALVAASPPGDEKPVPTPAPGDLTRAASTTVQSKLTGHADDAAQLSLF